MSIRIRTLFSAVFPYILVSIHLYAYFPSIHSPVLNIHKAMNGDVINLLCNTIKQLSNHIIHPSTSHVHSLI